MPSPPDHACFGLKNVELIIFIYLSNNPHRDVNLAGLVPVHDTVDSRLHRNRHAPFPVIIVDLDPTRLIPTGPYDGDAEDKLWNHLSSRTPGSQNFRWKTV